MAAGLLAAHEQRRANHQRVRVQLQHAPLGLELRAAVVIERVGLVVLGVRRARAAVEDDVGREVDQPGADLRRRLSHRRRAVRVDPRVVLAIGRVDYRGGTHGLEAAAYGGGVEQLETRVCRGGPGLADELAAEVAGPAGDQQRQAFRACSTSASRSAVSSHPAESRMKPSGTASPRQRARRSALVWTLPKLVASVTRLAAARKRSARSSEPRSNETTAP